jgi:hypothetical protein
MYNVKLYDYVPKPQPVKSDYLIGVHYYPAWKKGSAQLHKGYDQFLDYPERLPMLGRYDEEDPEVTDWEIKWAVEHGINCFIYCWYRYKTNQGKKVTVNDLRCGHGIHEGLFKAKYRNMIKFAIMFEAQQRWSNTDTKDFEENLLPFWMEEYFTKENYLVIDNKPIVYVYDYQNCVRDGFGSPEIQAQAFEKAQEYAKKFGFDGINFQVEYRYNDLSRYDEYKRGGYNSTFSYCWNMEKLRPTQDEVIDEQMKAMYLRAAKDPYYYIPLASKQWDPRPRMDIMPELYGTPETSSLWTLEPDNWRKLLEKVKSLMDTMPKDALSSKMLILDNWNEWDEGHYLAPHYEGGFKYLQAVREVFTKRDNLPDYRTPEFLGFDPYHKNWGDADYSKYCVGKKLDK